MTMVYSSRCNYGELIGIIMLDTVFPRIPGDVGNATTFPFPVRYKRVNGASVKRVVKEADPQLLQPFIEAAQELEMEGVKAITTSCGFLVMFQKQIADAVKIPVLTSSLLQVPFVSKLLAANQKIGILTARASSLTQKHIEAAGMLDCNYAIQGMEEYPEFTNVFLEGKTTMDVLKVQQEMVDAATKLVRTHPEIGAIVFECTNMPPFAFAVQEAVDLPVFDIVTLTCYTAMALQRTSFPTSLR